VPSDLTTQAELPGMPGIRFWIQANADPFIREALQAFAREKEFLTRSGHTGPLPPASFLAVSGGGDNGAFGAGLLCGWSETGERPVFKVVTGVSTGALIAPFAFLGPRYDRVLREAYTQISQKDIFRARSLLLALFNDAMADTTAMFRLVTRYVTRELLAEIAAEYEKGRLLLVGTTDLDARQPVIWNMTAIAASGKPEALDLFRKIMLASSAVPGAFPPVMIDVDVNGRAYQEMHVDGGASAQVFLYPPYLRVAELSKRAHITRERAVYLIRNARLDPDWAEVERRTLSIAGRAISALIHSQGIGDLYRIYLVAQRDGVDYNLAYIPTDFEVPHEEDFDRHYMEALFERGYEMALKGHPWQKAPPGMAPPEATATH
jgi:predicted acylesterase/phospholipase RssA